MFLHPEELLMMEDTTPSMGFRQTRYRTHIIRAYARAKTLAILAYGCQLPTRPRVVSVLTSSLLLKNVSSGLEQFPAAIRANGVIYSLHPYVRAFCFLDHIRG